MSLILGIVWLCGLGSVVAVVLGVLGKREIDRSQGTEQGSGLAVAGIVVGAVGVIGSIAVAALFVVFASRGPEIRDALETFEARARLDRALAIEQEYHQAEGEFTASAGSLLAIDDSLIFVPGAVPDRPPYVGVATSEDRQIVCLTVSSDGDVFLLAYDAVRRRRFESRDQLSSCSRDELAGVPADAW